MVPNDADDRVKLQLQQMNQTAGRRTSRALRQASNPEYAVCSVGLTSGSFALSRRHISHASSASRRRPRAAKHCQRRALCM
jgi:hypothetical protein